MKDIIEVEVEREPAAPPPISGVTIRLSATDAKKLSETAEWYRKFYSGTHMMVRLADALKTAGAAAILILAAGCSEPLRPPAPSELPFCGIEADALPCRHPFIGIATGRPS